MFETYTIMDQLADLARELDRAFVTGWGSPRTYPALNVAETADTIEVRALVPGIKKEDLSVTFEDGTLRLRGKRALELPAGSAWLRRESAGAEFERTVRLGTPVDGDSVKAAFADGVLTLSFRKAEAAKPRLISIN